jgi:hypothetical protein
MAPQLKRSRRCLVAAGFVVAIAVVPLTAAAFSEYRSSNVEQTVADCTPFVDFLCFPPPTNPFDGTPIGNPAPTPAPTPESPPPPDTDMGGVARVVY